MRFEHISRGNPKAYRSQKLICPGEPPPQYAEILVVHKVPNTYADDGGKKRNRENETVCYFLLVEFEHFADYQPATSKRGISARDGTNHDAYNSKNRADRAKHALCYLVDGIGIAAN